MRQKKRRHAFHAEQDAATVALGQPAPTRRSIAREQRARANLAK
jgi:hypothetical protein